MVRAGVVQHPRAWPHGGYREIQHPPQRYALIELEELGKLCGFVDVASFQCAHRQWVEEALRGEARNRDERWTESIAVGSQSFVERVKRELGIPARRRAIEETDGMCVLREPGSAYTGAFGTENSALRPKNAIFWSENPVNI